jgi:hypothetical protein
MCFDLRMIHGNRFKHVWLEAWLAGSDNAGTGLSKFQFDIGEPYRHY